MELKELLAFNHIVIQCHDNPDADTLASGFGVYTYLTSHEKDVRLIYSGRNVITKSNLKLMVNELHIPVEHVTQLETKPELLLLVDCQYGQSNVTYFEAETVAVIDHHELCKGLPPLSELHSNMGSCSALIYHMLKKEKFSIDNNTNLATALYYGLMTDTNNFTEIHHPLDRDLRDEAPFDNVDIIRFRNSNISVGEIGIAGRALEKITYRENLRYAVVETEPCDPNILGIISDMALEVDVVDTCVVYSILPSGVKLSVRSCIKETKANELAAYVAKGVGNGGGHVVKAGGFLQKDLLTQIGVETPEQLRAFLMKRMDSYFLECEVIYTENYFADTTGMKSFRKKHMHLGYVDAQEAFGNGTKLQIRTMEGDLDIVVDEDTYIIIGIKGEIYPQKKNKFEQNYWYSDEEYVFDGEYEPTVKVGALGKSVQLLPYVKSCITTGQNTVFIKQLDHRIKLFTAWDENNYYSGNVGDFMAVRSDDKSDVYVINHDVFYMTYEEDTEDKTECDHCHDIKEPHHEHIEKK